MFLFCGPARFQKKWRQHNGELFLKEVQCLVQNLTCLWANSQASVDEFTCCLIDVIVGELVVVLCKEMICFPGQICLSVCVEGAALFSSTHLGACLHPLF